MLRVKPANCDKRHVVRTAVSTDRQHRAVCGGQQHRHLPLQHWPPGGRRGRGDGHIVSGEFNMERGAALSGYVMAIIRRKKNLKV